MQMKKNSNEIISGVNFLEMLFLLFLGLKLADKIDWSWWWIFAPIWMPILGVLIVLGIAFVWLAITNALGKQKNGNE